MSMICSITGLEKAHWTIVVLFCRLYCTCRCIVQEPEDTAPRLVSFMKVVWCQKYNWTNRVQGIEIETTNFPNRVRCTATPFLKLRDPQKGAAGHCALYQGTVKQPSSLPEGIGQRSTLFGPSMQNVMCKCKKQLLLQYIKEHSALWGQHCPCQRAMHRDLSAAGSPLIWAATSGLVNLADANLQAPLRI